MRKTKTHKTKTHKTKTHKTKSHKTKSHKTKSHKTKSHKTKSHKTKKIRNGRKHHLGGVERWPLRKGVGTRGQAAALNQVFTSINPTFAYPEIVREVLSHQSVNDRDAAERKERRQVAANAIDQRQSQIQRENKAKTALITDILAGTSGLVEPELVDQIQRQSRNTLNPTLGQSLRTAGHASQAKIQSQYDRHHWVNAQNERTFRNAMQRAYPNLDLDNLPVDTFLPLPPVRQMAVQALPFNHLP
jgi:hypothetical protein